MKNRLLKYRDDLNFPEWVSEHEATLECLYATYKLEETGEEADFLSGEFQGWCVGMYLETSHARKRMEKYPPIDSDYWEDEE